MCRFQWLKQQGRRPERGLEPCSSCEVCRPPSVEDPSKEDEDDGS